MKNPKNKAKALEELHQALNKAGKAGLFDEMAAFVDPVTVVTFCHAVELMAKLRR